MPFLLEPNDDVSELLRIHLATQGHELHRATSIEEAVPHLAACAHDAVLVGGEIAEGAWRWLFGVLPDHARVTLWSSHPGSRIPRPPEGRSISTDLLLGLPKIGRLVEHLLPRATAADDQGIA